MDERFWNLLFEQRAKILGWNGDIFQSYNPNCWCDCKKFFLVLLKWVNFDGELFRGLFVHNSGARKSSRDNWTGDWPFAENGLSKVRCLRDRDIEALAFYGLGEGVNGAGGVFQTRCGFHSFDIVSFERSKIGLKFWS